MQTLEIFFSETTQHNYAIFYPYIPWVCVPKVCSSGGAVCGVG